jgi:hypothetical protein
MAFRDRQWYINAIAAQEDVVARHRAAIDKSIECGEFSAAMMKCDDLKASLKTLNDLSNHFADKEA